MQQCLRPMRINSTLYLFARKKSFVFERSVPGNSKFFSSPAQCYIQLAFTHRFNISCTLWSSFILILLSRPPHKSSLPSPRAQLLIIPLFPPLRFLVRYVYFFPLLGLSTASPTAAFCINFRGARRPRKSVVAPHTALYFLRTRRTFLYLEPRERTLLLSRFFFFFICGTSLSRAVRHFSLPGRWIYCNFDPLSSLVFESLHFSE